MSPFHRLLVVAAALPLALGACRSPEEKLADRRRELRESLDALHGAYVAAGTAEAPAEGGDGGLVGRVVGELGRAVFEQHCLAIGRGERPFALSGRLESFMAEPANARACRRAADLQLEVDALAREVGARATR
jgi:hypothetical protein